MQPASHSEWVLKLIAQIDQVHPICGAFMFRFSSERRQVVSAYLSVLPPTQDDAAEVGEFLLSATHDAILARAYPTVPEGLRGALRRAGDFVPEERFFRVLYKLMSRPRHRHITECIHRSASLNLTKLRVLNILPERACTAHLLECLGSVQQACDLISSIELLVSAGANEDQLMTALRAVRDEEGLARVLRRALLKCRGPRHPVPASDAYRPITTARDLHRAATRYRNCGRTYTIDLLDDEAGQAFAEARSGGEGAVVHLRKKDDVWKLEGIFGPRNNRPSPALREQVLAHLGNHGIFAPERVRPKSAWDCVRRAAATPFYGFGLD